MERERLGGQVSERGEKEGEPKRESSKEREKERSQERLTRWGIFSHWVRIVLCYRLSGNTYVILR